MEEDPRPGHPTKLDERGEAHLIALACSEAPPGHDHWTLRLLANKVVELGLAPSSPRGIRKRLKKTVSSRGRRRSGVFPVSASLWRVWRMCWTFTGTLCRAPGGLFRRDLQAVAGGKEVSDPAQPATGAIRLRVPAQWHRNCSCCASPWAGGMWQ